MSPPDPQPDLPERELDRAIRARLAELLAHTRERLSAGGHGALPEPRLDDFDHRLDAGRALPPADRRSGGVIELNRVYLRSHFDDMIEQTLPHELAHLIVMHLHPRRRLRPHGPEWQTVMRDWFGVEPERTHRFDVEDVPARRQRRWRWRCDCREHELSTVRHNRALRGTRYLCRECRQPLVQSPRTAPQAASANTSATSANGVRARPESQSRA
ncbi:MAG: SprT-like domain-containing protein [Gammaproteobacteria bacterium]|nr:SprT-like domain-containing protein [Gammaproteobacteria bacterium]